MGKTRLLRIIVAFVSVAALTFGQEAQSETQTGTYETPLAQQPQPKSQQEIEGIQAIINAPGPDARIEAVEDFVADFPDSEFKPFALQMATMSAQQLNDVEKVLLYGERTLEADPDNYTVLVIMAATLGQRTREFDLDKEEKLTRADNYADKALDVLEDAPRPNPNVSDQEWEAAKKDFRAQAHEALGLVAMVRKDWDKAIADFKTSIDVATTENVPTKIRLGMALNRAGRYDEAITVMEEVMADTTLDTQLRSYAQAERLRAIQAKEAQEKKQ